MRKQWIGACLLLAGALVGPAANRAAAQWDVSGYESTQTPLPLGNDRPDTGGIYGYGEFLFMHANRSIGSQAIAKRGFIDSDGSLTGAPGLFVGSGRQALDTTSFGRTTWTPGFRFGIGYRLEDGTAISLNYAHLASAKYWTAATAVPPDFNPGSNLSESFLFSPVFAFSPNFAGPQNKVGTLTNGLTGTATQLGSGGSPYGIWNGATTMEVFYVQRFDNWDLSARLPVYETETARSYALVGFNHPWIWETFKWRTVSYDQNGNAGPLDVGVYSNILSQQMYGPMIGCGSEIYLGKGFSFSGQVTAAALLDIVKERARYELGDQSAGAKRSRMEYNVVPNVNGNLSVNWFPINGVQFRAGYNIWSFFNTTYMEKPVGFDFGAIDPSYKTRVLRLFHGFNIGVSFNF
jgi:hypothetical protein